MAHENQQNTMHAIHILFATGLFGQTASGWVVSRDKMSQQIVNEQQQIPWWWGGSDTIVGEAC